MEDGSWKSPSHLPAQAVAGATWGVPRSISQASWGQSVGALTGNPGDKPWGQIPGTNPGDTAVLCEPGQIVIGHPLSPQGTAILPDQKLLPYLFRETGERPIPAAPVPPAMQEPSSPGGAWGRSSGQPKPRRTGWSSLGTGRTCRSSWPG